MNTEIGLYWIQEMLTATVVLAGPLLIAALVVGLIVSIFQAATSIQEMTLSYVPKMVVIVIIMFFFLDTCSNTAFRLFNVFSILSHL